MSIPIHTGILLLFTAVSVGVPCGIWALGRGDARDREPPRRDAIATDPSPESPAVALSPVGEAMVIVLDPDPTLAGAVPAQASVPEEPSPPPCGWVTCSADQVCCNASCGVCAPPGETCSNKICGRPETPTSVSCGMNTCNVGEVCCNASCGVCRAPGVPCDQSRCNGAGSKML